MRRFCMLAEVSAVVAALACSEPPTGNGGRTEDSANSAAQPPVLRLSELTVSNAIPALVTNGSSGDTFAYVSLRPGALPSMSSVRIRNAKTGRSSATIPLAGGGFDPVPIRGAAYDAPELTFLDEDGATSLAFATIPLRHRPSVVRVTPGAGGTDVAIGIRPEVIFSEPVDPASVTGLQLVEGGIALSASVVVPPNRPWSAELHPGDVLESETLYELRATTAIRDVDGDPLEPYTSDFTSTVVLRAAAIAFVSNREGTDHVYVANADGSGVTKVAKGTLPAWSPDGMRLAFVRDATWAGAAGIYVIGVGSNLQYLGAGHMPTWSPNGQIAFLAQYATGTTGGFALYRMNADGSGLTRLLEAYQVLTDWGAPATWLPNYQLRSPAWSPDGRHILFQARASGSGTRWHVGIVDADGANPLEVEELTAVATQGTPAWSPGGSRLAVITDPGPWVTCSEWFQTCGPGPGDGQSSVIYTFTIGSDLTVGDRTEVYTHPAFLAREPAWSPDGLSLLFAGDYSPQEGLSHTRIFSVSLPTGEVRQLIADAAAPPVTSYSDWAAAWIP